MGMAIETTGFYKTNPGAGAAAAAVPGDSLVLRSFSNPATARLLGVRRMGATAGYVGVKSSTFHDDVTGIRLTVGTGAQGVLLPRDVQQPLRSADTLVCELSGGAAETDAGAYTVYYDDVSGIAANLVSPGDIATRVRSIKQVAASAATSGAATGWNDSSFTAVEDVLHADGQYAVLGYITDTALLAVGLKGPCTGNVHLTGPGSTDTADTFEYFVRLSEMTGLPCIPVLKQGDKGSTTISFLDAAGGVTPHVSLLLAELS